MPFRIQYKVPQGSFVDAPSRLYVLQGTTVEFRATRTGGDVEDLRAAQWDHGTLGRTRSETFNTRSTGTLLTQATTISVAEGTDNATVGVTVFSLTPSAAPSPAQAGHHATNFGVGERVELDFQTNPAGVAAADAGGLRWALEGVTGLKRQGILQQSGTNVAAPDSTSLSGTAYYIAPYTTDDSQSREYTPTTLTKTVRLTLTIQDGPSKGGAARLDLNVLTPVGILEMVVGSEIHTQGSPSAGFRANLFLTPDDVSFVALEFREAGGRATAHTGCFAALTGAHRPTLGAGSDSGVQVERTSAGRNFVGEDTVQTRGTPTSTGALDGRYVWSIYWQYRLKSAYRPSRSPDTSWIRCQTVTHEAVSDTTGRCTQSKDAVSVTKDLNDATCP